MNQKPSGEIIIYRTKDGHTQLDVRLEQETIWLDAHQMAKLFGRDRSVIVRHIGNIYKTRELSPSATYAKNAQGGVRGSGPNIQQVNFLDTDLWFHP